MTPEQCIKFFTDAAIKVYPLERFQEFEAARQMLIKALLNGVAQQNITAAKADAAQ